VRHREGGYLLRTNLCGQDPAELWQNYIQLVEIEATFKTMKNDLDLRPIYHELEDRIETHIFIAFLAYCLYVTLCVRLKPLAPGLTPTAVLDKHPLPACVGTRCLRESNGLNACSRLPHCYRAICRVHLGAAPDGADGPRSYSLSFIITAVEDLGNVKFCRRRIPFSVCGNFRHLLTSVLFADFLDIWCRAIPPAAANIFLRPGEFVTGVSLLPN